MEEEYTRREKQFLNFVNRHYTLIFLPLLGVLFIGLAIPLHHCNYPDDPEGKKHHDCLENMYLLSGWFSSWGVFATLSAVILAGIAAHEQLRVMNRTQKAQDALNLFSEIKKVERLRATRSLYELFCDNEFELNIEKITHEDRHPDQRYKVSVRNIEYIIHTYEQMGAFAHGGIIDEKFVASLITGACVRMWIILEKYVRRERERRCYPRLFARFEYLAMLCIQDILENEPKKIAIYHPDKPDIPKFRRTYSENELKPILESAQIDLIELRLLMPSSSIYPPRPHYPTDSGSMHNGYKSPTSASEPLTPRAFNMC